MMFSGCISLQGAVAYDEGHIDATMANPNTGYFTKKVLAQEAEAYVVHSLDMKRLVFYYDREREYRCGTNMGIEEKKIENNQEYPRMG